MARQTAKRRSLHKHTLFAGSVVLFGILLMLFRTATASAATPNDIVTAIQSGDIAKVAQLIAPAPTPAANVPVPPTPEAMNVATDAVIQTAGGTGHGQGGPNEIVDGKTIVKAPYAGSIFGPGPVTAVAPQLGPLSFGDSVKQGANQLAANAAVNPAPVCEFNGFSQGQSVVQNAAAQMDRSACPSVHITGGGTPSNTGNGFVTTLPSNLLITDIGDAKPVGPQDTADYYNCTGDMWGNAPDWRNPVQVLSSAVSLVEGGPDGTHYSSACYGNWREDMTYKTNAKGEIDPNGNVTQHVMVTENGLVILANKLGLNLDEPTKQMIRDAVSQPLPGVRNMPVTPRELDENPTPENFVKFFTGSVDEQGKVTSPVASDMSILGDLLNDAPATAPEAQAIPGQGPNLDQLAPHVLEAGMSGVQAGVSIAAAATVVEGNLAGVAAIPAAIDNSMKFIEDAKQVGADLGILPAAPVEPTQPAEIPVETQGDDWGSQVESVVSDVQSGNWQGAVETGLGMLNAGSQGDQSGYTAPVGNAASYEAPAPTPPAAAPVAAAPVAQIADAAVNMGAPADLVNGVASLFGGR